MDWDEALVRVRETAEFCAGAGLVRMRITEENFEIEIRRSARPVRGAPPPFEAAVASGGNGHASVASNGSAPHAPPAASLLKAEFVGVVRLARPTVVEGTVLSEDRELAYVESLGIRNPIRSTGPGRVAAVYVTDGQIVDFGAPLFSIEPLPGR